MNTNISAPFNLALEEVLAHSAADELFMLWRNGPSVIIGRNQVTLAGGYGLSRITHLCESMTGGTVYRLGNVNYKRLGLCMPRSLCCADSCMKFGVAFIRRNEICDGAKFRLRKYVSAIL